MTTGTAASLVNLLGFITGVVLYVMLLWMVLNDRPALNRLALLTGLLGFAWNVGAFGGYGLFNLGFNEPAPLVLAGAFSALCFLPAVVVHSAWRAVEKVRRGHSVLIIGSAYGLSGLATIVHFYSAIAMNTAPSQLALRGVTVGFAALLAILLVATRGQQGRGRGLWVVAMSVFAVSALHLSNHRGGEDPWWLQLAGHHASLPLALLILYQNFRFALADIFLKRALALLLLAGLTFGLKRTNYTDLAARLSQALDRCETPAAILGEASGILAPAMSAESIEWSESDEAGPDIRVQQDRRSAVAAVPTTESPHYLLSIRDLSGGRRLLSDDIAMLERGALLVARRIDAVRSMQERYRHDVQEQEMRKLAAEAELRALRAQVNPHFLFNALTTIGYLIQTAPDRAVGTLLRLSGLLRGVLKAGEEFVTIGEELDLIEAYLDIERARFEDRLRVQIDVPWELRGVRIPALVIQPLVENAIKHGISACLAGGEVRISARLHETAAVLVSVIDTGVGTTDSALERRKARGLGLTNIERRLERYGSGPGAITIRSAPGIGTTVEIRVALQPGERAGGPPPAVASAKSS